MSSTRVLTFVTGNKGKLAEVMTIMGTDLPFTLTSMSLDLPELQGEPAAVSMEKCKLAAVQVSACRAARGT